MHVSEKQLYHQVRMTYLRALTIFRFCPDLWLDFADYEAMFDKERAIAILNEAISIMPSSIFLRLACCDFYEEHELNCDAEYDLLIRDCPCNVSWVMYMQYVQRRKGGDAWMQLFRRGIDKCPCAELYMAAGRLLRT